MQSGGRARQRGARAGRLQKDPNTMHKVDNDKAHSNALVGLCRRARSNTRNRTRGGRLRRVMRCSAAKVQVNKTHVLLRHRRLEVVDEVDKEGDPSNVLEEPRRRAR